MAQPFGEIKVKMDVPDENRMELMPANPGEYEAVIQFPDGTEHTCPVLAFVVYWYVAHEDYGHPMTVEPLMFLPIALYRDPKDPGSEWHSEWDDGCAMTPTHWNHGRLNHDRMKWMVRRV